MMEYPMNYEIGCLRLLAAYKNHAKQTPTHRHFHAFSESTTRQMAASTHATTTASLVYAIKPEDGGRAYARVDPITGKPEKNWECEHRNVVVENLRGKEDSVTLDTAGFQYFKHTSKHTSFATGEEIHQEYYPESIELIKSLTGASRVVVFSHSK